MCLRNKSNNMQSLHEQQTVLRSIQLFSCLSESQLTELTKIVSFEHYPKFSFIYKEKEQSDSFYFLFKGIVKIGCENDERKELITDFIEKTGLFGEKSITSETTRNEFAQSITDDVEVVKVPVKDFLNIFIRDVPTQMNLLNLLAKKVQQTETRVLSLIGKDARSRIIGFLKNHIKNSGRKIGYEIEIKNNMTQQDIANFTGTSRQTVTQIFNELKKSDIIHFNRRSMLVRDVAKLC
jgi:CRP/FNR family cyclic AMP-dependent transcriptional regulator